MENYFYRWERIETIYKKSVHAFIILMELCANSLEGIWKERGQFSEREMHTAMIDVMMVIIFGQ